VINFNSYFNVIRLKQKDLDNKRLMHLYQKNVSVIPWKDGFIGGGNQIEKIADVFGPIRFLLPVCRLGWFLYTLNIYVGVS
jgi:hypothetical protein